MQESYMFHHMVICQYVHMYTKTNYAQSLE